MTWKKVDNADPGTANLHGGNDLDKVSDLFSGVDVDDVDINADWSVRSGKRKLRNPANTFDYIETASAIAANRTVTEPLLTANDTRVYQAHPQTLTSKTIGDYLDIDSVTIPANPAANKGRLYVKQIDANNDGLFCKIKKAGAFVEVRIL